ncbi:MAG: membrane dipeptidase [Myxococcota bacterium]
MGIVKKLGVGLLILVGIALVAVLAVAPGIVDASFNTINEKRLGDPGPEAARLHASAFIADLHSDSLLWKRDLTVRNNRGHVDFPRLREGNVAFQVFSVVTKSPKGQNYHSNSGDTDNITALAMVGLWPPKSWFSLEERAHYQANKLKDFLGRLKRNKQDASLITTAEQFVTLASKREAGKTALGTLLALEGAHCLEGDLDAIDRLFDAGYRMVGLAHFFDNELAGSAHGIDKHGLTEFGTSAMERFEALEMIIDLAHSSPKTISDVLSRATRPVVVSHGGVRGTCDSPRNLSDRQLTALAKNGALIGIGYWPGAICKASPEAFARAMRYAASRIPVTHLALGSDFDGSTRTPIDTSELALLTEALLSAGFGPREVRAILGGNARRFFAQWLPGGSKKGPETL